MLTLAPAHDMNLTRYSKLAFWLIDRYTVNGVLITHEGLKLSKYQRLSEAAWQKYKAKN